jgi:hypothetical protein
VSIENAKFAATTRFGRLEPVGQYTNCSKVHVVLHRIQRGDLRGEQGQLKGMPHEAKMAFVAFTNQTNAGFGAKR